MDENAREISEALLAIEAELRFLLLWESNPPSPEDLLSNQPFCCDTLDFPQWLQWILLPRMWNIIEQTGSFPTRCGIYVYAEEWAKYHASDSLALLRLVKRLDALIEGRTTTTHH